MSEVFQVESVQSCERDMFLLLALDSLWRFPFYRKGTRKIVPEREKESRRSASWLVSEWPTLLTGALIRERKQICGCYKFVLSFPAVSLMSCSSYLDGFRDGNRWPYSCCFVGFVLLGFSLICLVGIFLELFNIARSILMPLPSNFYSIHFVGIHMVALTQLLLGRNCVLFYQICQTSIWLITYQ